ncbi:MAG: radical SAM protein [Candidatus Acidiferrum sp.]
MTFSLRLTADLTLAWSARAMGAKSGHPLILNVSPDGRFYSACASVTIRTNKKNGGRSPSQSSTHARRFGSPLIWIGGAEPLEYLGISRVANEFSAARRHVFLQTSGAQLKRRLHEFQPSNFFYFVIRFNGLSQDSVHQTRRESAFRSQLEALRMARLAGFLTCAQLIIHPDNDASEVAQLHGDIQKLGVDGFLITRASLAPELEPKAAKLRRGLLSRRWALLSRLLDIASLPAASRISLQAPRPPLPTSESGGFGEGAEAG